MEQDLQRSDEDRHRIELMPKGFLQMKIQRLTTCKHVFDGWKGREAEDQEEEVRLDVSK